jgi:hypothetical protein
MDATIYKKIRLGKKRGVRGRDTTGIIHNGAYFSELDVRETCGDLLIQCPKADDNGFAQFEGKVCATVEAWSRHIFEKCGKNMAGSTIAKRLKESGKIGLTGKDQGGRICSGAFYSEADVREVCPSLFDPLPRLNENNYFEIGGAQYRLVSGWVAFFKEGEGIDVSEATIYKRLKKLGKRAISGMTQAGQIRKDSFFSEADVREACNGLMVLCQMADEEGMFILDGVRYGSSGGWAIQFRKKGIMIDHEAILRCLRKAGKKGIAGKDKFGRINKDSYFSEPDVFFACEFYLKDLPQADEAGFVKVGDKLYALTDVWRRRLHEMGIKIRPQNFYKIIKAANKHPITGRDASGLIRRNGFYSEADFNSAFEDYFKSIPQAYKGNFIEIGGVRHFTIRAWSRLMKVSEPTVVRRVEQYSISAIEGKDRGGRKFDYYSENDLKRVFEDFSVECPDADENGFLEFNGETYASVNGWSDYFKKKGIVVWASTIRGWLKKDDKKALLARDVAGRVRKETYFSESDILEVCADFLNPNLPRCGEDGFADVRGVSHGTIPSLACFLGISQGTLYSRISSSRLVPVRGKDGLGRLADLWSEPAVHELCADVLGPDLPRCDKEGFVEIGGVRHSTVKSLVQIMGISRSTICSRLESSRLAPIQGRGRQGRVVELYPEPVVRGLLADLLQTNLPKCGEDGFADIGGIFHGTKESIARLLGVGPATISRHLRPSGLVPIRAKDKSGHPADFYPVPAVRELCKNILEPNLAQADENGIVDIGGLRHGTVSALSKWLGVSNRDICVVLASSGLVSVRGKDIHGVVRNFYPESAVRELCRDLIDRKKNNPKPR